MQIKTMLKRCLYLTCICLMNMGCFNIAGECETKVSKRLFNPSRKLQAISGITDCGATTSPSYVVRIVESTDTTEPGSAKNTILGSRSGVDMEWQSNDTLMIYGADITSGYTMKKFYLLAKAKGQVVIVYKP